MFIFSSVFPTLSYWNSVLTGSFLQWVMVSENPFNESLKWKTLERSSSLCVRTAWILCQHFISFIERVITQTRLRCRPRPCHLSWCEVQQRWRSAVCHVCVKKKKKKHMGCVWFIRAYMCVCIRVIFCFGGGQGRLSYHGPAGNSAQACRNTAHSLDSAAVTAVLLKGHSSHVDGK